MNIAKLKACIAYACHQAADRLDPVKLNKVLWYTDAGAYMACGQSVTGARYIRKPKGPVAAVMSSALEDLVLKEGILSRGHRWDSDRGQYVLEYVNISDESSYKLLSSDEKDMLDHSIKRACFEHTTEQISERTHGEIWELAAPGEEMPLFTMFAERLAPIQKRDVEAAALAA